MLFFRPCVIFNTSRKDFSKTYGAKYEKNE